MNHWPLPLFRERFSSATRISSADKRKRFWERAFRAILAQPFAECRHGTGTAPEVQAQQVDCDRYQIAK